MDDIESPPTSAIEETLAPAAPPTTPAVMPETKMTASDFIRQNPSLSPNDVVAEGAKQGLKFSRNLVYLVRGKQKAADAPKRTPGRPKKVAAPAAKAPRATAAAISKAPPAELELAKLALSIGLDRSIQMLTKLRAAIG